MLGRPWRRWWRLAAGAALVVAGGVAGPAWAHEGGLTTVTVPPVGVTLPAVSLPDLATPPVSTPVATVPPVTLPPVTVPSVTVPPLQVGAATPAAGPATGSTGDGTPPSTGPEPAPTAPGTPAVAGPAPATAPSSPGPAAEAVATVTEPAPLAVRLRRAAAETVGQLSFPLGLALAIAGFLLVQHRLDRDDPRVAPPVLGDDDLLEFS